MSKKINYLGGSTIVHWGSNWFSRPEPGVDPDSGETKEERIRRLTLEAENRYEQKKENAKKIKGKRILSPLADLKRQEKEERRRQARVERKRAMAALNNEKHDGDIAGAERQRERMAKLIVEVKRRKKVAAPNTDSRVRH